MEKILPFLNNLTINRKKLISEWFASKYQDNQAFLYNSVDLRYSGEKLAPIDTNIFPAGFNNLSLTSQKKIQEELHKIIANNIKNILIIAEYHTRNLNYLHNLNIIKSCLEALDKNVKIASISTELESSLTLQDITGKNITIEPLIRTKDIISVSNNFIPELIIVNNDFSIGSPEILQNISQKITPPTGMGWYKRSKYNHFESYNKISNEFAKEFNFDPFYIQTECALAQDINFKEKHSLDILAKKAEILLKKLTDKYKQHNIKQEPYLFLKANHGTYGMGIMTIKHHEEILNINKKTRNKMSIIKDKVSNNNILIQEGIETINHYQNNPAEPLIYLINGKSVGTIIRSNNVKDKFNNLNSSVGTSFLPADNEEDFNNNKNAFNLIAELAALAATSENH